MCCVLVAGKVHVTPLDPRVLDDVLQEYASSASSDSFDSSSSGASLRSLSKVSFNLQSHCNTRHAHCNCKQSQSIIDIVCDVTWVRAAM